MSVMDGEGNSFVKDPKTGRIIQYSDRNGLTPGGREYAEKMAERIGDEIIAGELGIDYNPDDVTESPRIQSFKPNIKEGDKYGVAVPVQGGGVCIIATYSDREKMEEGYRAWKGYAKGRGITAPVPVEVIDQKKMTVKILKDLIE